jgi:uncharacterized protein
LSDAPVVMPPRASDRALVVMARVPRSGRCKTRLCPPLSPDEAALLYRCFLLDIARQTDRWDRPCDLWLAWTDEDDEPGVLRDLFGPPWRLLRQDGATLTDRMEQVFCAMFEAGYRQVVMRNSDSPHLPMGMLDQAFAAFGEEPGTVVLGPDLDGGYYLVGADRPVDGVFPREMSTASVYEQTADGARGAGLAVHKLPRFSDVDTPLDLSRLTVALAHNRDVCVATWQLLSEGDIIDRLEAIA